MDVVLKFVVVAVVPVVPPGVTATGTRGPAPRVVVPGGVAPRRKKPALDAVNP